jgi:sulfite exporter TauE/SafE
MERKNLIPALMLALLGIFMICGSIFIAMTNNTETFEGFKALIIFFIAGIILVAFAVYYAKTGGMSDKEWEDEPKDDLGIVWEFDEEPAKGTEKFDDETEENK